MEDLKMETIGRAGTVELRERFVLVYDEDDCKGVEIRYTTRQERREMLSFLREQDIGCNYVMIDME
jgi:hypothetical protein